MNCCMNCFIDNYILKYIFDNGINDNCDYCGSKNIKCIDVTDLSEIFSPLIETYDPEENFLPADQLGSLHGKYLSEILQDKWEIFSSDDSMLNKKILEDMFRSNNHSDPEPYLLDSYWQDADDYWGALDENEIDTKNLWEEFKDNLKYKNRFFIPSKFDFKDIDKTLKHLTRTFYKGRIFNRARKCSTNIKLNNSAMGKPPAKLSSGGRANPPGIPYLYLGNKPETCIAEIRPFKYEFATLAEFELLEDATLINLKSPMVQSPFIFGADIKYFKFDAPLLRIFNKTLGEPINESESFLEYLPSQYLCELIKNIGYEGIIYDSSQFKDGYNIVFFNDGKLKCNKTELIQINDARYSYVRI